MAKPTAASIAAKKKRTDAIAALREEVVYADDFFAVRKILDRILDLVDELP